MLVGYLLTGFDVDSKETSENQGPFSFSALAGTHLPF